MQIMMMKNSMDYYIIKNAGDLEELTSGVNVGINAHVHKIKRSGKIVFVYLSCGGDIIKTVCKSDVSSLSEGMYIRTCGTTVPEIKAENGIEIRLDDFEVLSKPAYKFPVSISDSEYGLSLEATMDNKSLTLRNPQIASIYKLQAKIINSFCEFMNNHDFMRLTPPVISAFSEKPSFEVDYFGEKAYLSHSPQLYMTAGTAAFDRVYAVSPAFLAKKYNSTRHLNEFTSLNFQQGYIDSVEDIIKTTAECMEYIAKSINLTKSVRIKPYTFNQALEILGKAKQVDLDPTDIKRLCKYEDNENTFVFVTSFPPDKRPFYAEDCNNFDLYFNGWKIASGSKNICDYNIQFEKASRFNIRLSDFTAYEDALKYGIMPYGSCIIGLERLTAALSGLDSVKYASLFPRDLHHLIP